MNSQTNVTSSIISRRAAALIAGLSLLAMAVLAGYANFAVLQTLIVPGNAQATANNLAAATDQFRFGIIGFSIVAILDVIVAWAMYVVLKPINKNLSLVAALLRTLYAIVFAFALSSLFNALQLVGAPNIAADPIMNSIAAFQRSWDIALVIFGIYLILTGYLFFGDRMPKWLGVLLVIAGLGYMIDSLGKFFVPGYNLTLAAFTFIGEVILIFWLLWKSAKGFEAQPRKSS